VVTFGDAVELGAAICDGAGQKIQPAGRGFGVGDCGDARRQGQPLGQRDQVDAAFFQHGALAQIHAVHFEFGDAGGDAAAMPGQERGADPVGDGAKTQIQAGGLHLGVDDDGCGGNCASVDQGAYLAVGQDAGHGHRGAPLRPE